MRRLTLLFVLAIAILAGTEAKKRRGKWRMKFRDNGDNIVDLTYALSKDTFLHPAHGKPFSLTPIHFESHFYAAMNRMETAEHAGTHIDSFKHFMENGTPVDKLPLKNLIGRAVMIDLTGKNGEALEGNVPITVQDLKDWEEKHVRICCGREIVFFRTGLGRYFNTDINRYLGTENAADPTSLAFPGVSKELAKYLVNKRRVRVVGTDTISTDIGNSTEFPAHRALLPNNVTLLENLANLDQLADSQSGFSVIILPMKILDGTGSPTRVVAIKNLN